MKTYIAIAAQQTILDDNMVKLPETRITFDCESRREAKRFIAFAFPNIKFLDVVAAETLDPRNENYVGHIRAIELKAPCLCVKGETYVDRNVHCPYHGR